MNEERSDVEMKDEVDSDSSDGEDPLRNLYIKQFDKMKVV